MELDERQDLQLVLPQEILGAGRREPDRLSKDLEQVERDATPCAQFLEGLIAELGEALVQLEVEERQRQVAAPDGRDQGLDRDAALLDAVDHPDSPNVAS